MSSPIWFRYPNYDNDGRDDDYIPIHRPDDEVLYDTCAERPDHNTEFVYAPLEEKFNPSSVSCV